MPRHEQGAQRPAHCPLKVDHGRQEANLGGVGGGVCGYELAVRQVTFERLSVSYLCAVAGSVLVVMSLIPDIVATPLPRRMASASSASVAGLLVVLPLILEIRSDACGMRDRHSPPTPRVLAVSTRRHGATQRCTGRLLGRIRLGQV